MTKLLIMAAALLLVIAAEGAVVFKLLRFHKGSKETDGYIHHFQVFYGEGAGVKDTLKKLADIYPEKSIEGKAVRSAYAYLDQSAFKDYSTAFQLIECVFTDDRVKEMHGMCIEKIRQERQFLLPQKDGSGITFMDHGQGEVIKECEEGYV